MRVAFRHFLLDSEGTLCRLSSAARDRMLHNPHPPPPCPLCRPARVRSAEVVVEMMNGRPLVVLRSVFKMSTFRSDGTLVPPLRDRHVRARAELALALNSPDPRTSVIEDQHPVRRSRWSMEATSCPRTAH